MYWTGKQWAVDISIHALREERDEAPPAPKQTEQISIHALREERDRFVPAGSPEDLVFQSTRSARSATRCRPTRSR